MSHLFSLCSQGKMWNCSYLMRIFRVSTTVDSVTIQRPAFFFFFFCGQDLRTLVPQPGIEPLPPVLEASSLNHWTTREVSPPLFFLISGISLWIILLYHQWLLVFSKVLFRVFHFCQKNLVIFSTCHSESKAQVVIVTRLLFSSLVVSDSLRPHGLQHARLPCPSLSPGV